MKKLLITMASLALVCACSKQKSNDEFIVEKPQVQVQDGRFTPEVMWSLGVMSEYAISPDGSKVLYTLRYTDMEQNKNNAELYLMPIEGGDGERLTTTAQSEFNPVWLDDNTIMFCRGAQILSMDLGSKNETVVAEHERGFEGFKMAPDHKSLVYISTIPVKRPEHLEKLYAGLDKTTGRINEDLMYRHWDNWVDEIPQIFYVPFENGKAQMDKVVNIIDSTFECPMRPWGGTEQYNYSPDSKTIVYTCRKKTGYDYAHSTNSDIFIYNIEDGKTINISDGIMGYDQNPVFSHNGKMVAWESMERDGYESDKLRLMVMDLETGEKTDLTADFDYSVGSLCWSADDKELFAVVSYRGMSEIFGFNCDTKEVRQLSHGYHDVNGIQMNGDKIVATQVSIQYPATLYAYSTSDKMAEGTKLSTFNDDVLSQVRMGKVEECYVKTVDGKDMLTWLIYPYDYDSTKTYPALLFCEGGPQSPVSQFWSTRWNFEVMSGAGYFVIAPNRRGVPGFGMEWLEEISGDYGGLCMQDYMAATDWAASLPMIDRERIGACGASFGGYSIYWLAGHNHDVKGYNEGRRFKAFLAHNGMFNFEQQYLETEEMWFDNWDLGGPYWDWNNPQIKKSYSNSPHLFVDKWNTPICVIHSEFDFRIVASEGMAAYNAAQMRHIPSRYLYFPDETHWVLKPQNSLLWHRNFIDWFDQYLKK
ncbi:MAG: prolyl oligopeptidase family serine peptidase [Bacteroidales bacterium]|nr:prolyl oligopeptidase family serine peptidase [Bacteroidales bacterium]